MHILINVLHNEYSTILDRIISSSLSALSWYKVLVYYGSFFLQLMIFFLSISQNFKLVSRNFELHNT